MFDPDAEDLIAHLCRGSDREGFRQAAAQQCDILWPRKRSSGLVVPMRRRDFITFPGAAGATLPPGK
jgi:hypothetical protein